MNTLEIAKKIKWIIKEIGEDISGNGFSTKFASLYLESDEDAEIWKDYVQYLNKVNTYQNLILLAVVINCDYFRLVLTVQEENICWWELSKYEENGDTELDPCSGEIKQEDNLREILELISYSWGNNFTECCHNNQEEAYESLLKRFQKIAGKKGE